MQQHHAPETAGRLAIQSFPVVTVSDVAATIRSRLMHESYESTDLVVVTDGTGRYRGVIELRHILQAREDKPAEKMMRADWPTVLPTTDQEHAVHAAYRGRVTALPVVTHDGRPLGILSPRVLLEVLAREHREDLHRIVGILRERAGAEHALDDPPLQRAARRLPWLLAGLGMSVMAVLAMAGFERMLAANVTIAFFLPALVYLTDAIGTQTEAMVIRALSLQKLSLGRLLVTEVTTGGLIGLALASVAFLGVWLVLGNVLLGVGVAISLLAAGTLASSVGLLLPWILSRANIDPAFGSGPVATIIQDVLTILIYFTVMSMLL